MTLKPDNDQPVYLHNEPPLLRMADEWQNLKAAEAAIISQRHTLEEKMLPFLEQQAIEGSTTTTLEDGRKIRLNKRLTRKIDGKKFHRIASQLPSDLRPVKVQHSLDKSLWNELKEKDPHSFALFNECLTTKPAKPTITVMDSLDSGQQNP